MKLSKPHFFLFFGFWFDSNRLALAQEPQSTPAADANRAMCCRSCRALRAPCLDLPDGPPAGPVSNKRLYFNASGGLRGSAAHLHRPPGALLNKC